MPSACLYEETPQLKLPPSVGKGAVSTGISYRCRSECAGSFISILSMILESRLCLVCIAPWLALWLHVMLLVIKHLNTRQVGLFS
jgi:hypothetical protein